MSRSPFPLIAFALAAACGHAAAPGAARCVAGQTVECPCADGARGAQTCLKDGSFAPCACAPRTPVARAAAPPCPDNAVLAQRLGAKTEEIGACAAGYFPQAGWVVLAWTGESPHTLFVRALLPADGGAVLARGSEDVEMEREKGNVDEKIERVVDLDGDGADEILTRAEWSVHGVADISLVVYRRNGEHLAPVLTPEHLSLEYSEGAYKDNGEECLSTVRVTEPDAAGKRRVEFTGTCTTGSFSLEGNPDRLVAAR